jgi:hypothetical protein
MDLQPEPRCWPVAAEAPEPVRTRPSSEVMARMMGQSPLRNNRVSLASGEVYADGGSPSMFTSQVTPNRSTHLPKSSPHFSVSIGCKTVPSADSLSQ